MNLSGNDFSRLYQLQDKFLRWWAEQGYPFYLTGGTALGRFYFNHRYSEDLDFFVNNDARYSVYTKDLMKKIMVSFEVDLKQSLFTGDFTRIFIREKDIQLKINLVNDIKNYAGSVVKYRYGYIDTPLNILSNKLVAITGRDEPKDLFDICKISDFQLFYKMDCKN